MLLPYTPILLLGQTKCGYGLCLSSSPPDVEKYISHEVIFTNGVRDYIVLMLDAEGHVTSGTRDAERIKRWIASPSYILSINDRIAMVWQGNCSK